ncbi:MAG: L,D-transpeptidase family protein [Sulfurovum sp.]|nr:L,D-transpeptidase family protein [Sulfurovaceae bacterium]
MFKIFISLLCYTLIHADKFILIDLELQEGYAYENGNLIMSGRVSTGTKNHLTPTGSFQILNKERFHTSNLWPKPDGGARMDYMLRLTNDGIAMHLGKVPKSKQPLSHGCIRLKNGFAQRLWRWADLETEVEISGEIPRIYRTKIKRARRKNYNRDDFFSADYYIEN